MVDQSIPIPIVLRCPACGKPHVDAGVWAMHPHRTHQCVESYDEKGTLVPGCGHGWTPSAHRTVGVRYEDLRFEPLDEPSIGLDLSGLRELCVDPERAARGWATGVFVRAKLGSRYESVDVVTLDRESFLRWLQSRPAFAEQMCLILLEHPREI